MSENFRRIGEVSKLFTDAGLINEGETHSSPEVRAFSNHTAETIEEWRDPAEDEVWT